MPPPAGSAVRSPDQVGPVDEGDGHRGAVGGRGPLPLGAVAPGVEVAEDGLALAQLEVAGREVQVEDRARGDQRGVLVAQHGRVVLGIGSAPDRRGRLGLSDRGRGPAGSVDHPHPGVASRPLVDDQVVGEGVDAVQAHPGPERDDLVPVVPSRRRLGGLHEPEVLGSVVGEDEESRAAASGGIAAVVVDAVLDALAPGLDRHRNVPSGSSASRNRTSDVTLESSPQRRNRSSLVRPIPR